MIKKISYHLMHADEYYTLAGQLSKDILKQDVQDPQLALLKGLMDDDLKNLDLAYLKPKFKNLTMTVGDSDAARDDAFRAFKTYVEACSLRKLDGYNEACELLMECIALHGRNLHRESYAVQTAREKKLILDLETTPTLTAAIATIGANDWFQEMKTTQEEFETMYEHRNDNTAAAPSIKTEDACMALRHSIEMIIRYINVMASLNTNPVFGTITQEMNQLIAATMVNVKSRQTRLDHQREETIGSDQ
ncbi:DUF6261 family protein [Ancylomarina longa]|uniref:Uncharacterized protein n=1 Tax=Ancylomarina longa TaxID=2487017 RepID=A0A434AWZ4_9BACT|nr:DUF6261 family protein [Ancylomarina longa]RUT79035.1 hypothetical protein DLK05_06035 [Ancylomarina longa]